MHTGVAPELRPLREPSAFLPPLSMTPSIATSRPARYKPSHALEGRESLNDRDLRVVRRVVLKGRHKTLGEITNEVNARLNTTLCKNTVRKYIAKAGFSNRAACKKPLLRKKTSKPDSSGARSAERGTKSGRRWLSGIEPTPPVCGRLNWTKRPQ